MSAETHGELPGPDDPAQILRVLPEHLRGQFLAEYGEAVAGARDPQRFAALYDLLRLWRLHAQALSEPGYADRQASAVTAGDGDVLLEEIIAGRTR